MSEDDSDGPMSADEVIASAQEIVDQLRERWRESGLPVSVLAHQMIGAGITDLTNERGVEAALELLRDLVGDIERAAARRAN
jgi:Cft2 family RNA processing exonuclease